MSLIGFVGTVRERPRVREVDLFDFGSTDRDLIDMSRIDMRKGR